MTTDKARLTVYLTDRRLLDELTEALRRTAPLELRGAITRSTVTEAALTVGWADVQARGRESDVFKALVTLPRCALCGNDAAKVAHPAGDIWYCQTCGTSDYISEVEL